MLEVQFPSWLDLGIGPPNARIWNKASAEIPIRLSEIRQLLTKGRVESENASKYVPTHFDTVVDVSFLLLLHAVLQALQVHPEYSLRIDSSASGVTLLSDRGTIRQLVFLYGRSAQNAYSALSAYINEVETDPGDCLAPNCLLYPVSNIECRRKTISALRGPRTSAYQETT